MSTSLSPRELLQNRALPSLLRFQDGTPVTPDTWEKRRLELLTLLQDEVYGHTPATPDTVRAEILEQNDQAFAGKAVQREILVTLSTPNGSFSFPFSLVIPKSADPAPTFLLLNFYCSVPNRYCPAEELIDNGYAIAQLFYEDVTIDNVHVSPDTSDASRCFGDKLAACYPRDPKIGCGKIGLWAFAASRVMDVLQTIPAINTDRIAVVGHSRLGKTALWCAAQDLRFSMAVSNDSGCGGAALFRGKRGERVDFMAKRFPYWFCGNYTKFSNNESEFSTDQHALLSLIAPRGVLVNSAVEDVWADPDSEFLSVCAAAEAYRLLGIEFQIPGEIPGDQIQLMDSRLAYTRRLGTHYFSRTDWLAILQYRNRHGL